MKSKIMRKYLNNKTRKGGIPKPRPGDYYESAGEAFDINPINGKTWKQTYLDDLKEWNALCE